MASKPWFDGFDRLARFCAYWRWPLFAFGILTVWIGVGIIPLAMSIAGFIERWDARRIGEAKNQKPVILVENLEHKVNKLALLLVVAIGVWVVLFIVGSIDAIPCRMNDFELHNTHDHKYPLKEWGTCPINGFYISMFYSYAYFGSEKLETLYLIGFHIILPLLLSYAIIFKTKSWNRIL